MRHNTNHQVFKTAHWKQLYDAYIPDLESISSILHSTRAICAFIDAEGSPHDPSQATEIGISITSTATLNSLAAGFTIPATLEQIVSLYHVESHRIVIKDRQRCSHRCEAHRFGSEHYINPEKVEDFVIALIHSFRQKHGNDSTEIILAGFDMVFEMRLLSTTYHKWTQLFTSWLDIQELAISVSDSKRPGLSETLRACGLGVSNPKDLHSLRGQHNAASDTVRIASVLLHLLQRPKDAAKLLIAKPACDGPKTKPNPQKPYRLPRQRELWQGGRPSPRELFPYIAKVRRTDGATFLAAALFAHFAAHRPVAVGAKGRSYGWVCLDSFASLQAFVSAVNDQSTDDDGEWEAVSEYDATIIPAQDLEEWKEREHDAAERKRIERRQKRLASENNIDTANGWLEDS